MLNTEFLLKNSHTNMMKKGIGLKIADLLQMETSRKNILISMTIWEMQLRKTVILLMESY